MLLLLLLMMLLLGRSPKAGATRTTHLRVSGGKAAAMCNVAKDPMEWPINRIGLLSLPALAVVCCCCCCCFLNNNAIPMVADPVGLKISKLLFAFLVVVVAVLGLSLIHI